MKRIILNLSEEIVPVYQYHLAKIGKRTSEYLTDLIVKDLEKNQPQLMKSIKKEAVE